MKRPTTIDPSRLFSAADHLLKALESMNGSGSMISMTTGSAYGDALVSSDTFRQEELVEAMDMLIRMGFVRAEPQSW
jgi:hypothetical protein